MKVTNSTEIRIVSNIRYVAVSNVAVLGFSTMVTGPGVIKVVKLVKGGYSVRAMGRMGGRATHREGTAVLRVDADSSTLADLFREDEPMPAWLPDGPLADWERELLGYNG